MRRRGKRQTGNRIMCLLVVLAMCLAMCTESGMIVKAAGEESAGAEVFEISSGQMTVVMDRNFPRVIEYRWGSTGKKLYGQSEELTQVKINNVLYTPSVTCEPDGAQVVYTLDFSETALTDVVITMKFQVEGHVLEMNVTEIQDPEEKVRYLEFPNHGLISVRSTQAGAAMAYNANFVNGDTFETAENKAVDSTPQKIGHVFLYTDELAASLESDMTCQYNYLQTKQKDGYKETSVWTIDFMYRGPDKSVTQLPWFKVTVTDDANEDGVVNWQDGALAYREIMDDMIGENLGQKTIAVNILLNYWGRQSWTWENGLDYVKRQALATDNFPQIMLVKGSHRQYGDGWPSYGDTNPLLGGNDKFRWLIEEGEKYNVYVGSHTNSVEAYPESPFYEDTPKYNGGVWDLVDRGGTAVDDIEYWSSGLLDERYEAHKKEFPDMKFQYLDVSAGRWDGKERRWTTFKTLQKFKEMGWTYFTEMYKGYVDYTLNDTTTNAESAKYVTWCHTYYYGEENGGGNHGNSDIRRFIINDQAIFEAGNSEYQKVLGPGYQKTYGTLGWSESQKTVDGMVDEFWQHTLADTWLKNFQIIYVGQDPEENNQLTAKFREGVKSVYDGTSRTISRNGVVYGTLNDDEQEIFLPWEPMTEEKIYTYCTKGQEKTWELPESWNQVQQVYLYRLDETNGKTLAGVIPVTDGRVTISYEPCQGYVVYKGETAQTETVWGDGSQIKDGNFNSNSLNDWKPSEDGDAKIAKEEKSGNYFVSMEQGSVSQEITGLTPGTGYAVSAKVRTDGSRKGNLQAVFGSQETTAVFEGNQVRTVMGNAFNNWSEVKIYFTAESERAKIILAAGEGDGSLSYDDIRIYEETNPYGAENHYYYEDFETTHTMGPFVHETSSLARLAHANNGVNNKVQLNGQMTIMMGGRNDSRIKTQPGMLKLEPNTGYDLTFTYKSSYGPSNGWKYSVVSESTGKKLVNKYLSSYDGEVVTEKISFLTDDAEDYILVFQNVYAQTGEQADLMLDDLTLDINEAVDENVFVEPDQDHEDPLVFAEAEQGILKGNAQVEDDADASGKKAVAGMQQGDSMTFRYINGGKRLSIKYKNTGETVQSLRVLVNGEEQGQIEFAPTDGEYQEIQKEITISTGATLVLEALEAENLALDCLSVDPVYEAEQASRNGWTGEISYEDASNGKLVWLNDSQKNNSGITFEIKANATTLFIRHTNEIQRDRLLDVYVNGKLVKEKLLFPYTGPKYVFGEVQLDLELHKGDELTLAAPEGETHVAMIDCISTRMEDSKQVRDLELDQTSVEFVGEAYEMLRASVVPEDAFDRSLIWSSSDETVVEVKDGMLVPKSKGKAVITVQTSNGLFQKECRVSVKMLPKTETYYEAEDGNRGINGYVAGTTKSAAGETLIWMNSVNWSTGKTEEAYWTYEIGEDADGIWLRYANQLAKNRYLNLLVNEKPVFEQMAFARTGTDIVCAEQFLPVTLKAGDVLKLAVPFGESDGVMVDGFTLVKGVGKAELLEQLEKKEEELAAKEEELRQAQEELKAKQTELGSLQEALTAKEAELGSVQEALTAKETELGSVQEVLTAKETELEESRTRAAELEEQLAAAEGDVTSLTDSLQEMQSRVTALESEKAALESQKTALESEKTALESEKTALEEQILALTDEITTLQTSLTEAGAKVEELEQEKESLISQIEAEKVENEKLKNEAGQAKEEAEKAKNEAQHAKNEADQAKNDAAVMKAELERMKDSLKLHTGDTVTLGNVKYRVTNADTKEAEAFGVAEKSIKTLKVANTVEIKGTTCKVTGIASSAFANLTNLTKVTIGTNVTAIGKKAFCKDQKLKSIAVKSKKVKTVGKQAFKNISSRAVIRVPKLKKTAYKKLLKGKGQKKTVKIK